MLRLSRRPAAILATAIAVATVSTACSDGQSVPESQPFVREAMGAAAMLSLPEGGLLYGERTTGAVRLVRPDGGLQTIPYALVAVSSEGQRGLVGLALDERNRLFAAWTDPDKRLLVGQVAPGEQRIVWRGPTTSTEAIGGHLAFARDGALLVGVGDLEDRGRVADPAAPNGKILRLDPDGPESQPPVTVSGGWNNPYAFAVTPGGELWVADNAPGAEPERLARGDVGGRATNVTELPRRSAPSALVALGDRRLVVCGFGSHRLVEYRVQPSGRATAGPTLAKDCELGVAPLADGRLAYATGRTIRVVAMES